MTTSDSEDTTTKRRRHKKRHKHRKRQRSPSSERSRSSSRRHRSRRDKRRKSKRKSKRRRDDSSVERKFIIPTEQTPEKRPAHEKTKSTDAACQPQIPKADQLQEERRRAMIPMSQEQYEASRSQVREVFDEESGRYRLVRGDGEIIERIVSRQQHQQINRTATQADGASFGRQMRDQFRAR